MLNLYVNKILISPKLSYIPLLYPFFGPIFKKSILFQKEVFKKHGFDTRYYRLTSDIKKSDLVLLPHDYWTLSKFDPKRLIPFLQEAKVAHKKILIDATGDRSDSVPVKNCIILRQSCYKNDLQANEVVIPGYASDLLENYCQNKFVSINKKATPSVGFVGWGRINMQKDRLLFVQSLLSPRANTKTPGIFLRQMAIKNLRQDSGIETNFIIRDSYSARTDTISLDPKVARTEFVKNILENNYSLCVRGAGNYSVRFYETLSLGRIPLAVNTDLALPLANKINYKKFCLFVDVKNISQIASLTNNYHHDLANQDFVAKQTLARETFQKYLRLDSFTPFLVEEISKRL